MTEDEERALRALLVQLKMLEGGLDELYQAMQLALRKGEPVHWTTSELALDHMGADLVTVRQLCAVLDERAILCDNAGERRWLYRLRDGWLYLPAVGFLVGLVAGELAARL